MANTDYFLKIDGIQGESEDAKHKDEIDLMSWNFGVTNVGTQSYGGGGGAGKGQFSDFSFTQRINKATPKLMEACATGKHIPNAILTVRKAGGEQQEYLKIKFTDLLISSYGTGGAPGEEIPMENLSFNYAKIEFEYKPQNAQGELGAAVKAGYDSKQNVKV